MALMLRLGMIDRSTAVFDYGCGQGDDVIALRANGYECFGWDPHHAPDGPRQQADVVNLGFVLNVIENAHERAETLRDAWLFARRVMTVAVMPNGKGQVSGLTPYKDGFVTRRGTFQRYFAQEDLREIVASATCERPVSLAPSIVSVFRDKDLEQEVEYRRRSRASLIAERFVAPLRPPRHEKVVATPARERIKPQLEAIWRVALGLGRLPEPSEIPPEVTEALHSERISAERAVAFCANGEFDRGQLEEAAKARRADLLVHLALTMFPGAPSYAHLPRSIQRDVRTFFGSHSVALEKMLWGGGEESVSIVARCEPMEPPLNAKAE
jgi:DNA phosphorothioation-associated putative methyltransferase